MSSSLFHIFKCLVLRTNNSVCFANALPHTPFG
jgi:hypothetical protein